MWDNWLLFGESVVIIVATVVGTLGDGPSVPLPYPLRSIKSKLDSGLERTRSVLISLTECSKFYRIHCTVHDASSHVITSQMIQSRWIASRHALLNVFEIFEWPLKKELEFKI